MKIRNGFVSNSSSSSFLILLKDSSKTQEELINKSMEVFIECYRSSFKSDPEYQDFYQKKAEACAKEEQYVFVSERIEHGAEESVEILVKSMLDKLGIKEYKLMWEE